MHLLSNFLAPALSILMPQRRCALLTISLLTVCMGIVEMGVAGSVSLLGVAISAPESLSKLPCYGLLSSACMLLPTSFSYGLRIVIVIMGLVCASITFKNIFLAYITWRQNRVSNDISWDCMCRLYSAYLRAPYVWHAKQNSADLQLYLTWKYYTSTFIANVILVVAQVIVIAVLLTATVAIAGVIALLTFAIVGGLGGVVYRFFRTRAHFLGQEARSMDERLSRTTLGCLHGMREVQIYGTAPQFYADMVDMHESYVRVASERDLMGSVPQWLLESLGMLLLLGVLLCMTWSGASEAKAVGTLALLAAVCWRMLPAVNKFLGGMLCLRAFLPYVRTVIDKLHEVPILGALEHKKFMPFNESIIIESVDFYYPSVERPALDNVSLFIPKGSMVGLVGMSGAGKSTLVNILSGVFIPESGHILVDGSPLRQTHSLHVGYVPQDLYVMDATLAENIAFSSWGQPIDRDRVIECCQMASIDFIDNLPEGIDSPLGERGARLSGGQRQRIGIARALYSRPDVLIFDEATSALDGATEAAIQQTILALRSSVTIVIVAHRLVTVEACDYVYWLEGGMVRKEGATTEVLRDYGHYLAFHNGKV